MWGQGHHPRKDHRSSLWGLFGQRQRSGSCGVWAGFCSGQRAETKIPGGGNKTAVSEGWQESQGETLINA